MIRAYKKQDDDQIVAVWRAASAIAHPFLTEEFIEKEAANIRNIYLPNTETFVFEQNGTVQGFIGMIDQEVGAIFVDPGAMKQGIGTRLIQHVSTPRSYLTVKVFTKNKVGRPFYEKCGFVEVAREMHEETGQELIEMRLG